MRRTFAKVEQMFKLFLIKICEHIEMTWIVNQLLILLFYWKTAKLSAVGSMQHQLHGLFFVPGPLSAAF